MSTSTAISRALVAQLVRRGVTTFILCPGSRSAPLAYALYDADRAGVITLHVETDERVAGFVALGSAVGGKPAAVVTTSGSAVANLHPAVEEAYYAGVPLFVISADRPAEIRGVRANQTTDHRAILAGSVRHFLEIPAGAPVEPVAGLVQRAVRAGTGIGSGTSAGPVHINVGLREPLMPEDSWVTAVEDCSADAGQSRDVTEPRYAGECRTVVVAGPTTLADLDLSLFDSVPVLAEPSSRLRAHKNAVMGHPILLSSELREKITNVVVIGHPTLTRDVSRLLADRDVSVHVVDETPTYTDVTGNASVISINEVAEYLPENEHWLTKWRTASDAIADELVADQLDFLAVVEAIGDSDVQTVVGASSIIRELNLYGRVPAQPVHANRGLAGIDGTVSTAIGLALASREPVRVVLGDLAFIHDAGSLIHTAGQRLIDLDVVVVDDSGGSLFSTLEYGAGKADSYDRLFRTEKEFDVESYASAVGANYVRASDLVSLGEAFAQMPSGIRIVHVPLDKRAVGEEREARSARRERLARAVDVALASSQ